MSMQASPDNPYGGFIPANIPNPNGPHDAKIVIYGYIPSSVLAGLAIAIFVLALIGHSVQLFRYRTWYFAPMLVGTAMETIGYIFRLISNQKDPYNIIYYVVEYFFIVVAPVFFSAAIYTTVYELQCIMGKDYAPLPPKTTLWTFIACDIFTTVLQVLGAGLVGAAYSSGLGSGPGTFNNILLAGLAVQVLTFAFYLGSLAWTLHRAKASPVKFHTGFICVLIFSSLAVYLRTVFRLAETAEGLMKDLSTHEVYFGVLEFAPIALAVMLLAVVHPGKYLRGKDRVTTTSV